MHLTCSAYAGLNYTGHQKAIGRVHQLGSLYIAFHTSARYLYVLFLFLPGAVLFRISAVGRRELPDLTETKQRGRGK